MNRTLLLASLSLVLTFCHAVDLMGASIVYNIQNYPAFQNGFTLTGTITTDGTISPTFTPNDITAYALAITLSNHTYKIDSSSVEYIGSIGATPTQLTIADPGPSGTNGLYLFASELGGANISWVQGGTPSTYSYEATLDFAPGIPGLAWVDQNLQANSLGGAPWIIAQVVVPEPDSLVLALLGGACLTVVVLWTRRSCRVASSLQTRPTVHS